MTNWPQVSLGDVFEIARGGSPRPIESFLTEDSDGLNWVSISDATRSGKVIEKTARKIKPEGLNKSRWVEPGDFILSNSMSFGRPYIMGISGCIHDGWLVLKPGKIKVDTSYLYHILGSAPIYAQFSKRATGTTVRNLNTRIVSDTIIPLPPISEQRRIGAVLDQANELINLRRKSLLFRQSLENSLFYSAFDLDLAIDGCTKLSDFADIQIGYPFKSDQYSDDNTGVSLCRGANVLPSEIDWSDRARYPLDLARMHIDFSLREGDVVLAMDRPWINSGFKVARVKPHDLPALLVQRVARIRALDEIDRTFLYHLVRSDRFQRHCRPTETTVPHISPLEVRNFMIKVPDKGKRIQFARTMAKIEASTTQTLRHMRQLEHLFASLQHRAFRGEL